MIVSRKSLFFDGPKAQDRGKFGSSWGSWGTSRARLRQDGRENSIWSTSHILRSLGQFLRDVPHGFGGSLGLGMLEHPGTPGLWRGSFGDQGGREGGNQSINTSLRICGYVDRNSEGYLQIYKQ
jgi:hypothetical protein